MQYNELFWQLFTNSGNIDAYLSYKLCSRRERGGQTLRKRK